MLGIALLFGLLSWIGYMAVEPYARRSWPKLMISWQRLLNGSFRDPLVGRDVLVGAFAGSVASAVLMAGNERWGVSPWFHVAPYFGEGLGPSAAFITLQLSSSCYWALIYLAILSIMAGILRRRWLGLAVTGLVMVMLYSPVSLVDFGLAVLFALIFLGVLTRIGLVAVASFVLVWQTLATSPPLTMSQWYAGRATLALLVPLFLLLVGFYVSLGGQPIFGSALKAE